MRTKLVVRRIPPNSEQELEKQLEPFRLYVDYYLYIESEPFSRCYINFTNTDKLLQFSQTQTVGTMEWAVYQRIPVFKRVDERINTLEDDPLWQEFLNGQEEQEAAEFVNNSDTTPLLEALKQKQRQKWQKQQKKKTKSVSGQKDKPQKQMRETKSHDPRKTK
ncbi:hypothetical protein EDD86DRAFT_249300 [Gorgonomyces haynaldii]|nr:hypothetical protein EDD86DRAFT_249300 [Gorgonomyces haynaldii]